MLCQYFSRYSGTTGTCFECILEYYGIEINLQMLQNKLDENIKIVIYF